MSRNCLKLNSIETEVLLLAANPSFWTPDWWPQDVGVLPSPANKAHNLGIVIDNKLTFNDQVNGMTSSLLHTLRTIKKILPFIASDLQNTVVSSLGPTKTDYNGLCLNLHQHLRNKLQTLQNAAARLLLKIPKYHSVSKSIRKLPWLRVRQKMAFKALCTIYSITQPRPSVS